MFDTEHYVCLKYSDSNIKNILGGDSQSCSERGRGGGKAAGEVFRAYYRALPADHSARGHRVSHTLPVRIFTALPNRIEL